MNLKEKLKIVYHDKTIGQSTISPFVAIATLVTASYNVLGIQMPIELYGGVVGVAVIVSMVIVGTFIRNHQYQTVFNQNYKENTMNIEAILAILYSSADSIKDQNKKSFIEQQIKIHENLLKRKGLL